MTQRKVLVSGATGQQGGSVVNALLRDGHHVIGITRNTDSDKSKALQARGVEMISVDFTDTQKLVEAMSNVDTVFALTTPFEKGTEHETEQGIALANAAKEAQVGHFIFNSVGDANNNTNIPHFDSKFKVEEHIKSIGLNHTIIAPVYFMENIFFPDSMEGLKNGVLAMAMPEDRVLQQVAVEDIGNMVAIAVNERDNMFGQRLDIAGDEISGQDVAATLSKVIGKPIAYNGFSPDNIRSFSEDLALMYEWFIDTGYSADLQELSKYNLSSFEQWASKQDWSQLK